MTKRFLTAVFSVLMAATTAYSATINLEFTGAVTSEAIGSGPSEFGAIGDPATASLSLTYMAGEAIPVGLASGGFVDFSLSTPDFSYSLSAVPEGFNDGFNFSINPSATGVAFFTSDGSFNWPNFGGGTLRTGFIFEFGTPLAAGPTTYEELAAALSQAGTKLTYRTNGNFLFSAAPGDVFDEFEAQLELNSVPLPAPALFLLSALGGLVLARKRKSRVQV